MKTATPHFILRSTLAALLFATAVALLPFRPARAQDADLIVTKSNDKAGSATLGEQFNWSIVVRNPSTSAAQFDNGERVFLDDLASGPVYGAPSIATGDGTAGENLNCAVDSAALACTAGNTGVSLPGTSAAITITLPVTPTATGVLSNPVAAGVCAVDPDDNVLEGDEGNNNCTDSVTVGAPDLVISKVNDVSGAIYFGESFVWRVTLHNQGDRVARFSSFEWMFEDELPVAAKYGLPAITGSTAITGTPSCVVHNKILACQALGEVLVGAGTGKLVVDVTATPTQLGDFTNSSSACAADPKGVVQEADEGNNSCTNSVTVSGVDLQLDKSTRTQQIFPGDSISYTLVYTNAGNITASNVIITESVPAGTSFNAAASTAGWDCGDAAPAGTDCHFRAGSLAATTSGSARFVVDTPEVFTTVLAAVVNKATIGDDGAGGIDAHSIDNAAQVSTPVVGAVTLVATQVDMLASDNDNNDAPSPGDKIRYTIAVTNTGSVPAESVLFAAVLDPNSPLVVGTTQTTWGNVVSGNQTGQTAVQVDLEVLPPDQPVVITFDVLVSSPLAPGVDRIKNQSVLTGANFATVVTDDPDTQAVADTTITFVSAEPHLIATMVDSLLVDVDGNDRPSPGDRLLYTVRIGNEGNRNASGVVYIDSGSANASLVPGSVTVSDNRGSVVSGNNAADNAVEVSIGVVRGRGDAVTLTYAVDVVTPMPAGVAFVERQGLVASEQLPQLPTDDPDRAGITNPTRTAIDADAVLVATKTDRILIDADASNSASPGDTLFYEIDIRNIGNANAAGVLFQDALDENVTLDPGGVQTTVGSVIGDNGPSARQVSVAIGVLGAGERASIAIRVKINEQAPADLRELVNQGRVLSDDRPKLSTDDPDQPGSSDPTRTLIASDVVIYTALRDYLLLDADNSGNVSQGDTLLYRLDVHNYGNLPARSGEIEIVAYPYLVLQTGTVQTDQGRVTAGNGTDDANAVIRVDMLPPGGQATITLRMTVGDVSGRFSVDQQAIARFDNPRGGQYTVYSDDPDTAIVGDRTVSALFGIRSLTFLYLPLVYR